MRSPIPQAIRQQQANARRVSAKLAHNLLRAARPTDEVHYDGAYTLTAGCVRAHFAVWGVEIELLDPYGDVPAKVTIAPPYEVTSIVAVVEGLLHVTAPHPCPPSCSDRR